jgi:ABC-type cobalamin/Fe3+-siderophores transport system ATPase subunit
VELLQVQQLQTRLLPRFTADCVLQALPVIHEPARQCKAQRGIAALHQDDAALHFDDRIHCDERSPDQHVEEVPKIPVSCFFKRAVRLFIRAAEEDPPQVCPTRAGDTYRFLHENLGGNHRRRPLRNAESGQSERLKAAYDSLHESRGAGGPDLVLIQRRAGLQRGVLLRHGQFRAGSLGRASHHDDLHSTYVHAAMIQFRTATCYHARVKPEIVFESVTYRYPEGTADIFEDLDLELPPGTVSLVGQNGTGKSTLLLLAAGRLLPTEGRVLIRGVNTRTLSTEEDRQKLASFIYQNMEFETDESIGQLLEFVLESGHREKGGHAPISELVDVFELAPVLGRRTQEISKGELQRTILAFSLLYGSPILAMDEPIFALEDRQKKTVMAHLAGLARSGAVSLYYSVHELDISRDYSDHILLFSKDAPPRIGPTSEVFTREVIEKAFEVPFDMLKKREELYRKYLVELLRVRGEG